MTAVAGATIAHGTAAVSPQERQQHEDQDEEQQQTEAKAEPEANAGEEPRNPPSVSVTAKTFAATTVPIRVLP